MASACGGEEIASDTEDATALPSGAIRVATFNTSLNRPASGDLIHDLSGTDNEQARATAEIIQRVKPDVVVVQEFDYDAEGKAAALFQDNYLSVSQHGRRAIRFDYRYAAPSNTGVDSGYDLDNDGAVGGPGDAHGFGEHPGQFGFVVYSRYPIDEAAIRTFQNFLWKDMPGAQFPRTASGEDWFEPEELDALRLSSKNHVDLPLDVGGTTVHILVDHPTPPAFDGEEDRNGIRNEAEIRFWADYLSNADYLRDDGGSTGGLAEGERFVICGDHNADPIDGSSRPGAIKQLLTHARVNTALTPSSTGARIASEQQGGVNANHQGDPSQDTGDFGDNYVGNLRLDYVLPSLEMEMLDAQVFWPKPTSTLFYLIGHSDHRLTWVDLQVN
ncbi:MAG TPA: endonuclease/exonuclease/phosphatase family protein [Polyangiaceae bacterium]|nr:endonuclease/exonuclease/phosphatase family protein [Polyangiaceae bacterium]